LKAATREKEKKEVTLAVDASWFLHRIFHTTKYQARDPGLNTAKRLIGMICKDALAVKAKKVLVAFDGNDVFRYKVDPNYKGTRNREGPSPYDHLDQVMSILADVGIPFHYESAYEADDIMCSVAVQNDGVTVLATADKDAFQYMTKNVKMYNSSGGESTWVLHTDVEAKFGVPPSLALDLQTLLGDKVDNVPQLVSRMKAINGLKKHGSLKEWWSADKSLRKIGQAAVKKNRKLVRMVRTINVAPSSIEKKDKMGLAELSWLPASYMEYHAFVHPKTKGLF
jgi:DNA polymerase-1